MDMTYTTFRRPWAVLFSVLLAAAVSSCSTLAPLPETQAEACPALQGRTVPATRIGLPSGDARVLSAQWVPAASTGAPAYCKVLGSLAPLDRAAHDIQFQLNLPANWNRKALQYGGGGLNGTLITGLAPLRDAAPTDALPIARGYATLGTDSGHRASAYAPGEPGTFALNDEMLENFAYASYKKVKDVAV